MAHVSSRAQTEVWGADVARITPVLTHERITLEPFASWLMYRSAVGDPDAVRDCDSQWNSVCEMG